MKKKISKFLSLALAAIMSMSLSVSAFAAEPVVEPYTPTEETTLGDVCRHFEPEWFASLPDEIQAQYDETLLKEAGAAEASINPENGERATVGWATVSANATGAVEAISYTAGLAVTIECPALVLTAVIYDDETGDLIDSTSSYETDEYNTLITDTCRNLEPNHRYRLEAIGLVTPPAGCTINGALHDSDTATTRS